MSTTLRRRLTATTVAVLVGLTGAGGATTASGAPLTTAAHAVSVDPIDPSQYVCSSPTAFDLYQVKVTQGYDEQNLIALVDAGALAVPSMYAELFGATRAGAAGFGIDGSATKLVHRTVADLARFWRLSEPKVQVIPQKGKAVFDDIEGVARVYQQEPFSLSPADAHARAVEVHRLVNADPVLQQGDNPFFTLGAYTRVTGTMGWTQPTTIIVGDGLLQWMTDEGLGADGQRNFLAHEYAHVMQASLGLLITDISQQNPVDNRTSELMADAAAGYYMAHRRGAHADAAGLAKVLTAAYDKGDCSFDWGNHHGTPNQRRAASAWGEQQAARTPRGQVMSAKEFVAAFNAVLPGLVVPDAR